MHWLYLPNLEVPTGSLAVGEMRDGPTEGVTVVRLPPGNYRPCIGSERVGHAAGVIAMVRVLHESVFGGWRGDRRGPEGVEWGGVVAWVTTNVAAVGFFDHELLAGLVERDPAGFDAWSRGLFAAMQFPHGFAQFGGDARARLLYVLSEGGGGRFPVCELLLDGRPVGLEVAFAPLLVDAVDVERDVVTERIAGHEPLVPQHL
ncbi:MAG: hypothetical protein HKN73_14190 [Gemmatimonadetes bacterium]|nr:hypothetical protein [Gemmatimonadota bacterium]